MRDLTKIIDSVVKELDSCEFAEKGTLVQRLSAIRTTACYTPPESMATLWHLTAEALRINLPAPDANAPLWARRVAAIMMDRAIPDA